MDLKTPKIDPEIIAHSHQMVEAQERAQKERDKYEHRYERAALRISAVALIIAVISAFFTVLTYFK